MKALQAAASAVLILISTRFATKHFSGLGIHEVRRRARGAGDHHEAIGLIRLGPALNLLAGHGTPEKKRAHRTTLSNLTRRALIWINVYAAAPDRGLVAVTRSEGGECFLANSSQPRMDIAEIAGHVVRTTRSASTHETVPPCR